MLGNLNEDFIRSDRDSFSVWGFVKETYQRCDVNLTKIHLLLEVFEHNNNLIRSVILLKRMASEIRSAGDIDMIPQDIKKGFTARDLMLT